MPKRIASSPVRQLLCLAIGCAAFLGALPNEVAAQTGSSVVVWGDSSYGQTNVPPGLTNVIAIAAGQYHCLALKYDGTIVAWGYNNENETNVPAGLRNVVAICAGDYHGMALKSDGTVVAWGKNNQSQKNVPPGLTNVIAIAAGGAHSLALRSDGTVVAWGWNYYGQTNVPPGLSNVVAIAGGEYDSLALKSDGTVVAWGYNTYGQTNVPSGLSHVVGIAAGQYHCLALKSNETVAAWGGNPFGQTSVPSGLSNTIAIAAGADHSLALNAGGAIVAWGDNTYGQCTVPETAAGALSIAAGGDKSMAITGRAVIRSQPVSQAVAVCSDVQLQVQVGGVLPLANQWFFNATNLISGATNTILELTNVQLSDSGAYNLVASNCYGAAISAPAVLTVVAEPLIEDSPTNQQAFLGDTVNFSVLAASKFPLVYQWFIGSDAILGATNAALQLTNIQLSQAGLYSVIITNVYGAATSSPARLDVFSPVVRIASEAALRAALDHTNKVVFACDGTIVLSNTIVIHTNTVLDATGHQVVLIGNDAIQLFKVLANGDLTLSNLVIADGRVIGAASPPFSYVDGESVGGGAVANEGVLNLVNCTFTNNVAVGGTGSIDSYWLGAAGNAGGRGEGGAICNSGLLLASRCTFTGNFAFGGAGGVGSSGDPMPWPTEGYPGGPGGDGAGGALFNSGTASLVNCTLAFNAGTGGSGGFGGPGYQYSPDYAPVSSGANGPAGLSVGAIYNTGSLMIDHCTFFANSGMGTNCPSISCGSDAVGGAICNAGILTINRSTFTNNSVFGGAGANGYGGFNADPTSKGSWSGGDGGNGGAGGNAEGGALYNDGHAQVMNSTFASNSGTGGNGGNGGNGGSGYYGYLGVVVPGGTGGNGGGGGNGAGGAVCNVGDIQIVNSTFAYSSGFPGSGGAGGTGGSGNPDGSAGTVGSNGSGVGALYSRSSTCWITNCTFVGNAGSTGTGGIQASGGVVANTLLAANSPDNGNFTDGGHNFISSADPELGPLADNGGPTLTMALLPGSPAIDAGLTSGAPATDSRGVPRTQGTAPDIGAFEYLYTPVFSSVTLQNTLNCQLQLSGFTPDQTLVLQASTNLLTWFDFTNVAVAPNGSFDCSIPISTQIPTHLFRLKCASP